MNCPNCGSDRTYRTSLTSPTINCENCDHSWKSNKNRIPLLRGTHYSKCGSMKGRHDITVWNCPTDPSRYSFALNYGHGAAAFEEFADNAYLSGSFDTPEAALAAGIKEIEARCQ